MDKQSVIESIDALIAKLELEKPQKDSLEWYLMNNLRAYRDALLAATEGREVERATHALSRFCTESMDWDTEVFRQCTAITTKGMRLAR
ncbi:MAG: hypothetical protein HYX62_06945 [Gammaproteobacteria bacterium]|jgi:hypothetical protein|nr:hypothetical protein [Gammaproteobacteria bacterium]